MPNRKERRRQEARARKRERPVHEHSSDSVTLPGLAGEQQQVIHAQRTQQISRGPIPDPETLEQYNNIIPGLAERIVNAWTEETEYRRSIERTIVDAQINDTQAARVERKRGQWFAFILAVAGFGGAVAFAGFGHPGWGTLVGGGTLASIVIAFLTSHRLEKQVRDSGSSPTDNTPLNEESQRTTKD